MTEAQTRAHAPCVERLSTLCCGPSGPHSSQGVVPALFFFLPEFQLNFTPPQFFSGAAAASCYTEWKESSGYLAFPLSLRLFVMVV